MSETMQERDEEYTAIAVDALDVVKLGRQGENDTQNVEIDCSAWLEALPDAQLVVAAIRPGENTIYLPPVSVSGGVITWPILAQDTAKAGYGRGEVRAMLGDKIKKSIVFRTRVEASLEGSQVTPSTLPDWVTEIRGSVATAQAAATAAAADADLAANQTVLYTAPQTLSEAQQTQARANISAARAQDAYNTDYAAQALCGAEAWKMRQDAMTPSGGTSRDWYYTPAPYEVIRRRRGDPDFAQLSAMPGALLFDKRYILDGTQTPSTLNTGAEGKWEHSATQQYLTDISVTNMTADTLLASGAQPSARFTTGRGDGVYELNLMRPFVWINKTNGRALVTIPEGMGVELTTAGITAYLKEHPVTLYYVSDDLATARDVYIALPRMGAACDMLSLFHRCVCIGDSLTRGYDAGYGENEHNRDDGYPTRLHRLSPGLRVWNFGASGATAAQWLAEATFDPDAEGYAGPDWAQFDLALILLGQNGSLSAAAEQTAYAGIIARLKAKNPNIKIFCLSQPGTGNSGWVAINKRAQDLAEANGAYYLDITAGSLCDIAACRSAGDSIHFNALGYQLMAVHVRDQLNRYILEHPAEFASVFSGNTRAALFTDEVE